MQFMLIPDNRFNDEDPYPRHKISGNARSKGKIPVVLPYVPGFNISSVNWRSGSSARRVMDWGSYYWNVIFSFYSISSI